MRWPSPRHWTAVAALAVVLSTSAFAVMGLVDGDAARTRAVSADASSDPDGGLRSDPYTFIGFDADAPPAVTHTPPFPLESGAVPTKSSALDFPNRFSRFIAKGTAGLDELAQQGHLTGKGTPDDPYILERFYVSETLTIQSTDRAIILREGYVAGQLKLNYVGEHVYVHHVYAKDLRVNENVERRGANTGGLFHDNHFGFVGQIRHFIGAFRDNQVGPAPQGVVREYLSDTGAAEIPKGVVFNFDGFHGADVHHNTFNGMVDIKLHGHNHGDCLVCPIHDHSDEREFPGALAEQAQGHDHDHGNETHAPPDGFRSRHSIRYHTLMFRDNTIDVAADAPFALRYNDRNHAGDDQTANSEPNEYLEDPHVHYQDITVKGNTLRGGPLLLDVFNAKDDRHTVQNQGVLRIVGNTIEIAYANGHTSAQPPVFGMHLKRADGITLRILDNTIRFREAEDGMPASALRSALTMPPTLAGIRMETFTVGELLIADNSVDRGTYGVWTHTLAGTVGWDLVDNRFQTDKEYRADSTENAPGAPAGGEDA